MIWLGEGIVGDDTDGHIDDIARFVDAEHGGLCGGRRIRKTKIIDFLQENYERLQNATRSKRR